MLTMRWVAAVVFVAIVASLGGASSAQETAAAFDSGGWVMADAQVVEHLGRKSLMGAAFLKDVSLSDVVIEVDVACTGARSYPGVLFRMQSPRDAERVYLRPHRAGPAGYPDAVQYVPTFNGVDSWQLYNGDGCTAGATIPAGEWVPVKIEVKGLQARVFVGDMDHPALLIHDLKRGAGKGTLGLNGPKDGSAYFSNFRYRAGDALAFDPPPLKDIPPGLVAEWEISQPVKAMGLDRDHYPDAKTLASLAFKPVKAESGGLLDFSRYFGRLGPSPDCVFARTRIVSDSEQLKKYRFGYSDEVTLFLNGKPLFFGDSTYRYRDPSFLGILGLFDSVYLPLRKGENEVLLLIVENMGGWGVMLQDASAVYEAPGLRQAWATAADFQLPETALYDPSSKALYVSNYDGYNPSGAEGKQAVAKLSLDGKTVNLKWAEGLRNPTGMAVSKGVLYVVEPTGLAVVELATGKLLTRHPIPGAAFLNDIAEGPDHALYLSDSRRNVIYRFAELKAEEWLGGPEISRPNGLCVLGSELVVGNNGDGSLKAVDLKTKAVRTIAGLGQGIIDGIEAERDGSLLVSHNEGRLFRVARDGKVTKLLDSTVVGVSLANFAFLPESGLLVFPTWTDNRVLAYMLGKP